MFCVLGESPRILPQFETCPEDTLRLAKQLRVRLQVSYVGGGIIHHLREDHRARRRQGPPCPPEVQGARMAVPD